MITHNNVSRLIGSNTKDGLVRGVHQGHRGIELLVESRTREGKMIRKWVLA